MHHQTAIAFDRFGIVAVVIYPVAIEGQRGITKKQRRIEPGCFTEFLIGAGHRWRGRGRLRVGIFAVKNVLPVGDAKLPLLTKLVAQRDKSERPGAAFLSVGLLQRGHPIGGDSSPQRRVECHPATGPHPPGQPHAGNNTAQLRVAITA